MKEHNILNHLKSEDFLTLAAAFTSITAIFLFIDQKYAAGIILLLSAAIIDLLDGLIARTRNTTTEFGRNLDFLQDTITYCVAVAVLIHMTVQAEWITYFLILFLSASLTRLARQQTLKHDTRHYIGLPVTFNLMLPTMHLAGITNPLAYATMMTLLSLLMVSNIKLKFL